MSFQEINDELTLAQTALENAIRVTIDAEEAESLAEIALIGAQSVKKKARLEQKLYSDRVKSLWEKSYNLRAESKLR
jgi:hypothetical protein